MRVAIAVNEFNIRGGTHKQVQRLAEHLRASGDTPTLLTKYFDASRCYPGIDLLHVIAGSAERQEPRGRIRRALGNAAASVRLAWAARDADVVNVHDNGLLLFWVALRLMRPRLAVVWQVNDLPAAFRVGASRALRPRLGGRLKNAAVRALSRAMARRMSLVTVNVSKNALRAREHLGVEASVLHCGVDLRYSVRPAPRRCERPFRLVSTGVFLPYRNYESILRAQKRLQQQFGIETQLTIIGSTRTAPDYARSIEQLAAELKVACDIRGEVEDSELLAAYRDSDVFLFLNVDQSWGLAVFEAMNCGLPVVVSKSVGAVELLRPGVDSLTVDPLDVDAIADVLARLHRAPEQRETLASAGFEATLAMTWEALYCEPLRRELRGLCVARPTRRGREADAA